jgi:P pilus assembly chaperone PapD
MRLLSISILAVLLSLGTAPAWAEAGIQQKQIQFAKGQSGATVSGKVKGDQTIDHQLRANAGQTLTVDFKPGKPSAYFNILPPGSTGEALFIGSSAGNHFKGGLSADGVYTLRV